MDSKVFAIIIGMMLVTYIPRMLPLVVLSKMNIPPLVLNWLKYIPIAVLASLLAPEIFMNETGLDISLNNQMLLAAIPAFIVASLTKNLFYTVFSGMGAIIIISRFLG
ncbi:MAG: AzlD domain-containing protein [Clostridia bacterium]|nr:AzlD domain-containing protein [Clostridia bacterium]